MSVSDERLEQLANDPMMCNITEETRSVLREALALRAQFRASLCPDMQVVGGGDYCFEHNWSILEHRALCPCCEFLKKRKP